MGDAGLEEARKTFRGLGVTVVILGLLSLIFLGHASEELRAATFAAIAFCAITGIWLLASPSVAIGVTAGVSLAVLGIVDLLLAEGTGGFALVAPLIDFGFAIKVFIGCSRYAKALSARGAGVASPE